MAFAKELGITLDYERQVKMANQCIHDMGFGWFQIKLTLLAGFGWLADNIWFEVLAMTLTPIDYEWGIKLHKAEWSWANSKWATFSLYSGLLIGSLGWGFISDIIGRRPSWNLTLFISAAFGIAVGSAPSFPVMCVLLGLLGLGLGGNLPVDGAMLIEYIPGPHQWILTFLSLFWCIGQLYAALIGWAFISNYHCAAIDIGDHNMACPKAENWGWRYSWFLLGGTVMLMWAIRFFVYPIPESPKFLLATGREEEAYQVLQFIAKENRKTVNFTFAQLVNAKYRRTDEMLDGQGSVAAYDIENTDPEYEEVLDVHAPTHWSRIRSNWEHNNLRPSYIRRTIKNMRISPISALFASKKMAWNTTLISACWGLIGLGYPLYNSFIGTYLQAIGGVDGGATTIAQQSRQLVIFAACGIPGSFIAAGAVELPYAGRRGSMAIFTLLTGVFLFCFTTARTNSAVLGWNCATSLTENAMYAVLYAITYEVFPAPQRGTGDGFTMSVQRVFGIVSTIVGIGVQSEFKAPIYVSGAAFLVAGVIMFFLPYEPRGKTAL
ncbi:transmembrane transporter [Malassezia pachydermatis]